MIRFFSILLFIITISGCSTVGMENFMVELWVIKSAEYEGQKHDFGQGLFLSNTMKFDSSGECEMPGWLKSRHYDNKGNWIIDRNGDKYYLEIKNCITDLYNSRYEIIIESDNPKMIILESDSLKLMCVEVQMIGD